MQFFIISILVFIVIITTNAQPLNEHNYRSNDNNNEWTTKCRDDHYTSHTKGMAESNIKYLIDSRLRDILPNVMKKYIKCHCKNKVKHHDSSSSSSSSSSESIYHHGQLKKTGINLNDEKVVKQNVNKLTADDADYLRKLSLSIPTQRPIPLEYIYGKNN